MKIDPFTLRRARKALKQRLEELRATVPVVRVVDDALIVMVVELDNGAGERMTMTLDPLGLVDKMRAEAARTA